MAQRVVSANWSSGTCVLPVLDWAGEQIFWGSNLPYTSVRAAVTAVAFGPNGAREVPLFLMVRP